MLYVTQTFAPNYTQTHFIFISIIQNRDSHRCFSTLQMHRTQFWLEDRERPKPTVPSEMTLEEPFYNRGKTDSKQRTKRKKTGYRGDKKGWIWKMKMGNVPWI